jgi:bifunctional non-homologous end joining protein LigD
VTKLALAAYYSEVADRMLPYASGRPLSLVRLPEGLGGERFFQKHAGKGWPAALKTVAVEESDGTADYIYVDSAAGLVGAVQMGRVEFHIWGARRDRLDRPDRLVFDLDPDEALGFAAVRDAAMLLHDRLGDLGLPSWPLLTGGKGLHVVVELARRAGWEPVARFARLMAQALSEAEPQRFVAKASMAERKGRIFIDWLRNGRGATAVAPFSVRARPGAPVAMPVGWDELPKLTAANAFGMAAARERGFDRGSLPKPVALTARMLDEMEKRRG